MRNILRDQILLQRHLYTYKQSELLHSGIIIIIIIIMGNAHLHEEH